MSKMRGDLSTEGTIERFAPDRGRSLQHDGPHGKPHSEPVRDALRRFGLAVENVILIPHWLPLPRSHRKPSRNGPPDGLAATSSCTQFRQTLESNYFGWKACRARCSGSIRPIRPLANLDAAARLTLDVLNVVGTGKPEFDLTEVYESEEKPRSSILPIAVRPSTKQQLQVLRDLGILTPRRRPIQPVVTSANDFAEQI